MSYTPPSGSSADLKFSIGYSAPAGGAANLTFGSSASTGVASGICSLVGSAYGQLVPLGAASVGYAGISGSAVGVVYYTAVARDKLWLSGNAEGQFPRIGDAQGSIRFYTIASGVQRVTGYAASPLSLQGSATGWGLTPDGLAFGQVLFSGLGQGVQFSVVSGAGAGALDGLLGGQASGFGALWASASGSIHLSAAISGVVGVNVQASSKLSLTAQASGVVGRCGTAAGSLRFPNTGTGAGRVGILGSVSATVKLAGVGVGWHKSMTTGIGYGTLVLRGEAFHRGLLVEDMVYVSTRPKVVYVYQ